MSLTAALNTAKTGITATQTQIAGTSDNIANALTPGYVAKEAALTPRAVEGRGGGIEAEMLRGPTNSRLLRDLRFETAAFFGESFRADALSALSLVSGQSDEERSLAAAFTRLTTAFQSLHDAPESPAAQRGVLEAAKSLATSFSAFEAGIREQREAADAAIATSVEEANLALVKVDEFNGAIIDARAAGQDVSGLMDERNRALAALSELIGIRTQLQPDGDIAVMTKEGVTLLDGEPRTIVFSPTSTISPDAALGAAPPAPALSGLFVDGLDITPTGGGTQAVETGRIAGAFAVRDTDMPAYQRQIDELARATITLFQDADGTVPGTSATGLFTDAGAPSALTAADDPAPGLAGRLAVNAAVDPAAGGRLHRLRDGMGAPIVATAPPGDTGQIDAFLTALQAGTAFNPAAGLESGASLFGYASSLVSGQQLDRVAAEAGAEGRAALRNTLESRHIGDTGVNVDEENMRLLELEQAYAANAQVISTISRMFDELLASVR